MIDDAERMHTDQPELTETFADILPMSRHDFGWSGLYEDLFEDKDYEGYLYAGNVSPDGDLEHWFESFYDDVPKRDPDRGFRR